MSEPSEPPRKRLPIRWLTLAEIVGVSALVIAGLGYWDNHRQTMQDQRERAAATREREAEARAAAKKPDFLMTGTPEGDGGRIRLASVHGEQVIQTQTVWFPSAIRAEAAQTTGNPRLEAGWIDEGVRKAKVKGGRVPVAVMTVYIEDGETRTDNAIYQLAFSLHGRMLRGDEVRLEGLSFARRKVGGDLQKAVDSLWAAR